MLILNIFILKIIDYDQFALNILLCKNLRTNIHEQLPLFVRSFIKNVIFVCLFIHSNISMNKQTFIDSVFIANSG